MSGFDKARFAESIIAAVIGGVVNSHLQDGQRSQAIVEIARKFQRSLLLAMNYDGFTEAVTEGYLGNV